MFCIYKLNSISHFSEMRTEPRFQEIDLQVRRLFSGDSAQVSKNTIRSGQSGN